MELNDIIDSLRKNVADFLQFASQEDLTEVLQDIVTETV